MINWISNHRTWFLFLILGSIGFIYLGYISVWEPALMLESARVVAGETVTTSKAIINFISQKNILDLIKVLTPFLLPIITWKIKATMDTNIRQTTNKIVRDKLKIDDRRRTAVNVSKNKRNKT